MSLVTKGTPAKLILLIVLMRFEKFLWLET